MSTTELAGNNNVLQRIKRPALRVAAGLSALFATYACGLLTYDTQIHEPTQQESMISDAIKSAHDMDVTVRCVSEKRILLSSFGLAFKNGPPGGVAWPLVPVMWLPEDYCNGLSDFAANPPANDSQFKLVHGELQYTYQTYQLAAIDAVAHELAHIQGATGEGLAVCDSVDNFPELAVSFGLPVELLPEFKESHIAFLKEGFDDGMKRPERYILSEHC